MGGPSEEDLDKIQFARPRYGGAAIPHAQLAEDVVVVGLDGADDEVKIPGDLLIGQSGSQQAQHFQFTLGERLDQRLLCPAPIAGEMALPLSFEQAQLLAGLVGYVLDPGRFTAL